MRKKCSKCLETKPLTDFYRSKAHKLGRQSQCIACFRIRGRENYRANTERENARRIIYYANNKEDLSEKSKMKRFENPEKTKAQDLKYRARQKAKGYYKTYREENLESLRKKDAERTRRKRKTDLKFKLKGALRTRLRSAIKNGQKTGSAVEDLGCSIPELVAHLEDLFQPGMTWENYGRGGWHIDHILPLSSFNLEERRQLLKACHYTNLQPLWEIDNIIKGNKLPDRK